MRADFRWMTTDVDRGWLVVGYLQITSYYADWCFFCWQSVCVMTSRCLRSTSCLCGALTTCPPLSWKFLRPLPSFLCRSRAPSPSLSLLPFLKAETVWTYKLWDNSTNTTQWEIFTGHELNTAGFSWRFNSVWLIKSWKRKVYFGSRCRQIKKLNSASKHNQHRSESTFLLFEVVGVFCHPQRRLDFDFSVTQQILQRGRGRRTAVVPSYWYVCALGKIVSSLA